jgi:tricorn protease
MMLRASLLLVALAAAMPAQATPGYYRYPDLYADKLVFCAEADLWLAPAAGGAARRLTTHAGSEYFPQFSPDGKWIAFTGEYDGNRDVYVIAAEGGDPRRLTWHPASDEVVGFTPDGKRILFRSSMQDPHRDDELYTIAVGGGEPEKLPLGWAVRLDIDPASGQWAFVRKGWEGATWKRYRGGTAPDIWVGHPERKDFKKVTTFDGVNSFPMWHGGKIWFLSDQGGTANLWSMNADGSGRVRQTNFEDWDARWPSMAPDGRIAFVLGADIEIFDPATKSARKVEIDLPSDRVRTRVRYPEPERTVSWFDMAPDASRLAVVTRGEIFSVPVKEGVTLPISHGSAARESWAGFDGEGKRLVYVTDEPLEEEIRVMDAWGRGTPKVVVPAGATGWHFAPQFSPDGKWIAWGDQKQTLWVVPSDGGKPTQVDHSDQAEIRDYAFSADGRFLAYSRQARTDYASIWIYDTRNGSTHQVTGPTTNDRSPAWDPEGRYLYFLSDRGTNPVLDTRDWDNIEARDIRPYALLLRKELKDPFLAVEGLPPDPQDEKKKEEEKQKNEDKKDEKKDEKPKPVEIDFDGLAGRVVEFPVPVGTYFSLGCTAKQVFWLSTPLKGFAEGPGLFQEPEPDATLIGFSLEDKKPKPFLEGVSGFSVARKADKLAVMKKRGEIYVVSADAPPAPDKLAESKVALDGMVLSLDPLGEWRQIYFEGWRHMRDFYWDTGMGGVDWRAVRDRYATLLPRLATRDDLRDLMGEVIGELSTSHTYVFGGDAGVQLRGVPTGLLGADITPEKGVWKVERIYRADPADRVRSPLDEPGVHVAEGDYILAVNQQALEPGRSFFSYFENLAGKRAVLTVNSRPTREGARDVVVQPLASEDDLRYSDWVRHNREYVAAKTGGRIGYIHLPDMWQHGLIEFNTWFYPQLDRQGMVVDVRWNGGGAVSQMLVERLRRRVVSFDRARGGGQTTYPYRVLNGPFVVLTNEFAGSDGDIFPMAIQLEGLAPVIGMRSWGGVVGIRGDKLMVDGGFLTQPEFAWWDPKQGWALENRGVIPDIELQNLPQDLARGVDAQLDRAIAEVLRLHGEHPPIEPKFGPVRDRSRGAYRDEK